MDDSKRQVTVGCDWRIESNLEISMSDDAHAQTADFEFDSDWGSRLACSMLLVQFRVLPCTFHHAAAVFLNGIAAWQTHGAATQERRCKAFRLVSQKQNQISCNSRVLYSKCFLSLRFVLSDVISVGQRITWPAAKANTKTKTRLKFIAVKPLPELRGLSPKLIRSVAIRLV